MRIKYYSDVHMEKEKQGKGLTRFRDPRAAENIQFNFAPVSAFSQVLIYAVSSLGEIKIFHLNFYHSRMGTKIYVQSPHLDSSQDQTITKEIKPIFPSRYTFQKVFL